MEPFCASSVEGSGDSIYPARMRTHSKSLLLLFFPALALAGNPKIAPGAVYPITQAQYPQTYAKWGAAGVRKINSLLQRAAEKAASSPDCDSVELVELSDERSVPGKKIVFFVDCANRSRLYVEDSDLVRATAVRSQTEKMAAIPDEAAIAQCTSAVKAKLENPMTFSRSWTTSRVSRAPSTGNILVEFSFEAKNNFGAMLRAKARCILTERDIEATISKQ